MRLAENTGRKKDAKLAICATSHNFVGLYLRNYSMYRQSEKNLLNSNIHVLTIYGKLLRTNGWDRLASSGHPSKFQRVSRLGFVTAPTSLNGR